MKVGEENLLERIFSTNKLPGLLPLQSIGSPTAQSLTPYQARVWYSWRKSQISTLVNRSNGLEAAAIEAVEMRNTIRTTTRKSMKDVDIADFLNTKESNKTFETMYKEKSALFTNLDDIYNAIIESSMKGRDGVDLLFKIPKQ
jgi:hypothetical protein